MEAAQQTWPIPQDNTLLIVDDDRAFLARLQIRGERLTTFFDQSRNVVRQRFDIDIADRGGFVGWLVHTRAPADRSGPDRVLLQATFQRMVSLSLR